MGSLSWATTKVFPADALDGLVAPQPMGRATPSFGHECDHLGRLAIQTALSHVNIVTMQRLHDGIAWYFIPWQFMDLVVAFTPKENVSSRDEVVHASIVWGKCGARKALDAERGRRIQPSFHVLPRCFLILV